MNLKIKNKFNRILKITILYKNKLVMQIVLILKLMIKMKKKKVL